MPNAVVKSYAKKSGKSVEAVEKMWDEAKVSAHKAHPDWKDGDRLYAYVNGTVAKRLGLKGRSKNESTLGGRGRMLREAVKEGEVLNPLFNPTPLTKEQADDINNTWKPASGHPGGWRVIRGYRPVEQYEGASGRPRLYRTLEAAQAVADRLNSSTEPKNESGSLIGAESPSQVNSQGMFESLLDIGTRVHRIRESVVESTDKPAALVGRTDKYDFYEGEDGGGAYWNIVPSGSEAPTGGYRGKDHIERVKGVKFSEARPVRESTDTGLSRNTTDQKPPVPGAVYLDLGFWRISEVKAKELCGGRLPRYGYEQVVDLDGKKGVVSRTQDQGKSVWSLRVKSYGDNFPLKVGDPVTIRAG